MSGWTCRSCGRESTHIRTIVQGETLLDLCDHPSCGNLASMDAAIPDVFWNGRPYFSQALGVEFTSRGQKAKVMKELGVSELGNQKLGEKNWIEGSREARRKEFDKERLGIRENYKRYLDNARRK